MPKHLHLVISPANEAAVLAAAQAANLPPNVWLHEAVRAQLEKQGLPYVYMGNGKNHNSRRGKKKTHET